MILQISGGIESFTPVWLKIKSRAIAVRLNQ